MLQSACGHRWNLWTAIRFFISYDQALLKISLLYGSHHIIVHVVLVYAPLAPNLRDWQASECQRHLYCRDTMLQMMLLVSTIFQTDFLSRLNWLPTWVPPRWTFWSEIYWRILSFCRLSLAQELHMSPGKLIVLSLFYESLINWTDGPQISSPCADEWSKFIIKFQFSFMEECISSCLDCW